MPAVATTKMSSRGQVVIPEALRRAYGWGAGTAFAVFSRSDAMVLQPVKRPSKAEFDDIVVACQREAKACGLTAADIEQAIQEVRSAKRVKRDR
jgi:bifunctional DNA-binding transcriptional regulator/antitoxin component of YhaV-PrlF toxin-antitoxin module